MFLNLINLKKKKEKTTEEKKTIRKRLMGWAAKHSRKLIAAVIVLIAIFVSLHETMQTVNSPSSALQDAGTAVEQHNITAAMTYINMESLIGDYVDQSIPYIKNDENISDEDKAKLDNPENIQKMKKEVDRQIRMSIITKPANPEEKGDTWIDDTRGDQITTIKREDTEAVLLLDAHTLSDGTPITVEVLMKKDRNGWRIYKFTKGKIGESSIFAVLPKHIEEEGIDSFINHKIEFEGDV